MTSLADELAASLAVEIPEDLRAWLGGARRHGIAAGAYMEDGEIDGVLDPGSAAVWGGQHLPDAIPVLGNGGGDVLLLRFDWDGRPRELVEWLHEGGFWRPFGEDLCEALVLSVLCPEPYSSGASWSLDPELLAEEVPGWSFACERLAARGADPRGALRSGMDLDACFRALAARGIGGVAPLQQLAGEALVTPLQRWCREHGGDRLARELGLGRFHEIRNWLSAGDGVPEEWREAVCAATAIPVEDLAPSIPAVALDHARATLERRRDVAWPHALLAEERLLRGDAPGARTRLAGMAGLPASSLWLPVSAWPDCMSMSFLRDRIGPLLEDWPDDEPGRHWAAAVAQVDLSPGFARDGTRRYWLDIAEPAEALGDFRAAYEAYWLLGWDEFSTDHMDEVLERLERAARLGGSPLANVARLHLESLRALESHSQLPTPRGSDLPAFASSRPGCLGALLARR